ncbi:MAG: succinylglutamate-semialdehyde dehydrogenase [Robiginitomaculum sp.]|nr:MAG: succinylglutamate-semialdehyde dehydrogenase [Robiginitomaculum sp.]
MSWQAGNYINGAWVLGKGEALVSLNPSDGTTLWQAQCATTDQINAAYDAARAAFLPWSRLSADERAGIALKFKAQLEEHKEELATLIAKETGKVLWETRGEVGAMIGKVGISINAYNARTGENTSDAAFGRVQLRHRPHGVMAVLGPYNFPGHLPNGHIVPALLAGDCVVFKPSELTPAVGAFMVDLWDKAGLPAGVLNLVQGARDTGAALLDNPTLNGVLFTGSAATGTFIHQKFAGHPEIILALEMGGNNPLIVWDTKAVDAAANLVVHSAFATAGQRCSCARRLFVPQGAEGDLMVEAIAAKIDAMRFGPWDGDPEPFAGPLISEGAANMVLSAQASHVRGGASLIREAKKLDWSANAVSPSLLDMGDSTAEDEEVFGPLLQVYRMGSFEDAITRANATKYGLSAGLISDDAALWDVFVRDIRAGIVNFNRPTTGAASTMPFGGPGLSGNFRPGAWYAADYCAWPMASQIADAPVAMPAPGLD